MNRERVAELVKELLIEIGEDPAREGLERTPERVAESLAMLTSGYGEDPAEISGGATFECELNNMIIAHNIEVYSMCEHHMLPFFGRCHIGYVSKERIMGVSKLARIADCYARRLQNQERMTTQIAMAVMEAAGAQGVGVVIECRHLCMMMRGVEKQNSVMTTSSILGTFRSDPTTRQEFLSLIARQHD
ncbi:MAG: GTP cyclohydrolase I FolE [Armatimonadia bacterium]|nr:GTP cyclohydrolase I FolE [Armatimonadia bacterium]